MKYEKSKNFSIFSNVTRMLFRFSYPNRNLFIPTIMHLKKFLMEDYFSSYEYISMADATEIIFNKYLASCNLFMSVTNVLTFNLKNKFINFIFPTICSSFEIEFKIEAVDATRKLCTISLHQMSYVQFQCHKRQLFVLVNCMLGFAIYFVSSGFVQASKFVL